MSKALGGTWSISIPPGSTVPPSTHGCPPPQLVGMGLSPAASFMGGSQPAAGRCWGGVWEEGGEEEVAMGNRTQHILMDRGCGGSAASTMGGVSVWCHVSPSPKIKVYGVGRVPQTSAHVPL